MIKNTLAELEASLDGVEAGKKEELLALVGRLKGELSQLEDKHASLRLSLKAFEVTHPQIVEAVNEISSFLAKIGI
jgi:hypothetical protein